MPHDSVGPDLSFLDKKINFGRRTHISWVSCFDKQTTQAHVPNSSSLVTLVTPPVDPDALGYLDPRVEPP